MKRSIRSLMESSTIPNLPTAQSSASGESASPGGESSGEADVSASGPPAVVQWPTAACEASKHGKHETGNQSDACQGSQEARSGRKRHVAEEGHEKSAGHRSQS